MESKEHIYLRFPVQILKHDFYDIKKVCRDAMAYGIIEYMERNEYEGIQGFIQTFRDLEMIYGDFKRSDYSDQPKEAIDHLEEEHYSKPYGEYKQTYDQYKDSIETVITCSIKRDLLLDFRNNKKSDFEIVVFRFFIALNSIKGVKPYGQTSYNRIFALMFGYNTDKVLKQDNEDMALLTIAEDGIYSKYGSQYQREKIVQELELHWHLKWVGAGSNGNFFSWELGYKALNTLKRMAYINKKKPKEKLIRDKKKGREDADKELKDNGLWV